MFWLRHYVRLRARGVEALISGRVVIFKRNHRVLPLCHLKVLLRAVQTKRVGRAAANRLAVLCLLCHRVGVNRHKEVAISLVGDVATFLQGEILVAVAGIYHFYPFKVTLDHAAKLQGNSKIDILLITVHTERTLVAPSVSGVYHYRKRPQPLWQHDCRHHEKNM